MPPAPICWTMVYDPIWAPRSKFMWG
jgi:hypothetical protein